MAQNNVRSNGRAISAKTSNIEGLKLHGGEKAFGELLGQQLKVVASDAKVVVLQNTGHWVLEENPKGTTDALVKFL
jgi:pimeloyl-ACP methyl ester carboxylesterase